MKTFEQYIFESQLLQEMSWIVVGDSGYDLELETAPKNKEGF